MRTLVLMVLAGLAGHMLFPLVVEVPQEHLVLSQCQAAVAPTLDDIQAALPVNVLNTLKRKKS